MGAGDAAVDDRRAGAPPTALEQQLAPVLVQMIHRLHM